MELERAQLKDCARHYSSMQHAQSDGSPIPTLLDRYPCEADGFRNLIRLRESQDQEVSAIYFANDEHQMDEMMSHALIATVAYALKFNSEETAFVEHGEAWNQYLKNDFEPKWRSRQLGLPSNHFLTWTLFHTDVSFLRYHHYMAKMNEPDAWRRAEFERLARLLRPNFRDFQLPNNRGGVIWDHAWVGANGHECQAVSTNYAAYTIQALEDLTLEGVSPFGGARLMRRISNTIATNVLSGFSQGATRSSGTFPADICGDRQEIVDLANAAAPRAPYLITLSGKSRTTESKYASLPLTNLGAFGNKNQFIALAKTLKPENSSYPFLIGGIVFSLLYTGTP
jgi:hypothetical protein